MMHTNFKSITAYIASFPPEIQARLEKVRQLIHAVAPTATEAISYQMPTFKLNGNLIHFAAMKHHLGLYPAPAAVKAFAKELKGYKTSKGAIQFPYDKPLPLALIQKITEYRVKESLAK